MSTQIEDAALRILDKVQTTSRRTRPLVTTLSNRNNSDHNHNHNIYIYIYIHIYFSPSLSLSLSLSIFLSPSLSLFLSSRLYVALSLYMFFSLGFVFERRRLNLVCSPPACASEVLACAGGRITSCSTCYCAGGRSIFAIADTIGGNSSFFVFVSARSEFIELLEPLSLD